MKTEGKLQLFCLIIMMACTACAGSQTTLQPRSTSSETDLRKRADTYWQNKIKLKFEGTYPLETPAFRKRFSVVDYARHYGGEVVFYGAKVKSTEIDGRNAIVTVVVKYSYFGLFSPKGGAPAVVRDHWTLVDGQWYHVLNLPGKSFNATKKKK